MLSIVRIIRLFQKRLSFTNAYFATTRLYTNVELDPSDVVVFNLIERNGSGTIRQNNMKEKTLRVYCFLIKRKKLSAQPNITT